MTRTAAVLAWIAGLGFGLPCVFGIWYFVQRGEVWTFLGFPAYGGGPFPTTTLLLASFLLVCAVEVVVGGLLWRNRPGAALFSVVLLPVELAFWIGFALPFGPVLGVARTALVLAVLVRTRRGKVG